MSKKKTSFTLNIELLKDLKMKAVEMGTSQTKLLEKFIKQGLENNKEIHNLAKDETGTIIIDNINPNLLKKISKIAKNEKITEEEAINNIIENGIEVMRKNKFIENLIINKDTYIYIRQNHLIILSIIFPFFYQFIFSSKCIHEEFIRGFYRL